MGHWVRDEARLESDFLIVRCPVYADDRDLLHHRRQMDLAVVTGATSLTADTALRRPWQANAQEMITSTFACSTRRYGGTSGRSARTKRSTLSIQPVTVS